MATTKKTTKATEVTEPAVIEPKKYKVKANLDPNSVITVKSGFEGVLIYKSKKTGETFRWDHFGSEQDIELAELKNAKNSYKSFFENNWFLFDDPEVIDYLGVSKYYKHALTYDEFDKLFKLTPDEITEKVKDLSSGQKKVVAYRAKSLFATGGIDSISVIKALENGLGIRLIEEI